MMRKSMTCLLLVMGISSFGASFAEARKGEAIYEEIVAVAQSLNPHTEALSEETARKDTPAGCREIRAMRLKIMRMYELMLEAKTADPAFYKSRLGGDAGLEQMAGFLAKTEDGLAKKCAGVE
ncbi:hypothetical protein [Asticcacaulis sp. YBE204]|uniref:hypothetical protein n=1 Tax=Asticcacaulis sp. YBE204 TaxID=1282363 RepID=UPI0003C3BC8D|nr:hypothetical protein [Asticcacaulis sp. YBE204]ESQ80124.1 hypothetical protein AEYBE204_05765 [Asticcacaulis sp. YBE204]